MGLDVSHDCWHGAYSAFMRWRVKLAEVAGFPPLGLMAGFFSMEEAGAMALVRSAVKERWGDEKYLDRVIEGLPIKWDYFQKDPLTVLLYHSDCDGTLEVKDLIPLADRLQELIPLLPDEPGSGHIQNWKAKTQQFIDGLRDAASKGEIVRFG